MLQVYSRRNSNPFLLERPNNAQAKPSFKNFHTYYDEILKQFPLIEKIKNQTTKKQFETFKAKIEELDAYSILCDKKVNDAENFAKRMRMHSNSIIKIFPPITEKNENNNHSSGYQPILDLHNLKENPLLKESIKTVIETSNLIMSTGSSLSTSLKHDEEILGLIQQTTKIYECFKIEDIINGFQSRDQIREKLNELESKLQEIEQIRDVNEKNFLKNKAAVRTNQSSFDLTKKELDLKINESEQVNSIIKTILSDIENIRKLKANAHQTFEQSKVALIKKYDDKLETEIIKKQLLLNKIDDEQLKVVSELKDNKNVIDQTVNYILIIDKSGSMSSQMNKINKAAENFLLNLKKTNNKNFKFTIIYFDDQAYLKAETLSMSSINSFSEYLNMGASGGTDYFKAFDVACKVVQKNLTDKIDRVMIIFFTDGGDGGNRDDSFKKTKDLKMMYSSKILMYIRGLGDFSGSPLSHLQQIANSINQGSDCDLPNSTIKYIDTLNDINLIVDFFLSISSSYVDYYTEIEKKIQSLEKIKEKLNKDKEKLAGDNLFALEEELKRIELLRQKDLTNAEKREETIKDCETSLNEMKDRKKEIDSKVSELSIKLEMHKTDLELSEKLDKPDFLNELILKKLAFEKSIAKEKISVIKKEFDNERLRLKQWEKKSEELGFPTVDQFLDFKMLIEDFKDNFLELQKTSNNYGTRISMFGEKVNIYSKNIEERISKNRDNEINQILDKISGQNNDADALGESLSNWVNFDEKNFNKKEFLEFCKNRQLILKIMKTDEKKRMEKGEEECDNLDCIKDILSEIGNLEQEIQKEYNEETDLILEHLEKELIEIEKSIDNYPDDGDKEVLKKKKVEKNGIKEQISKRKEEIVKLKMQFKDEKMNKIKLKDKKNVEKLNILRRMKKAMQTAISLIERQDRNQTSIINSMIINEAIKDYKEAILCIEDGSLNN